MSARDPARCWPQAGTKMASAKDITGVKVGTIEADNRNSGARLAFRSGASAEGKAKAALSKRLPRAAAAIARSACLH